MARWSHYRTRTHFNMFRFLWGKALTSANAELFPSFFHQPWSQNPFLIHFPANHYAHSSSPLATSPRVTGRKATMTSPGWEEKKIGDEISAQWFSYSTAKPTTHMFGVTGPRSRTLDKYVEKCRLKVTFFVTKSGKRDLGSMLLKQHVDLGCSVDTGSGIWKWRAGGGCAMRNLDLAIQWDGSTVLNGSAGVKKFWLCCAGCIRSPQRKKVSLEILEGSNRIGWSRETRLIVWIICIYYNLGKSTEEASTGRGKRVLNSGTRLGGFAAL